MNYPKITNGLGKLSPQLFARIMAMLRVFESAENSTFTAPSVKGLNRPTFLAKITGSASIATNRYEYSWTEVVLTSGDAVSPRSNARSGTEALNLCEMANTATSVGSGVDVGGTDYPSNFSMMPIGKTGDGTLIDVVVVMSAVRDEDGVLRSVFSMVNSHDGNC